jgi:hypothetical protein
VLVHVTTGRLKGIVGPFGGAKHEGTGWDYSDPCKWISQHGWCAIGDAGYQGALGVIAVTNPNAAPADRALHLGRAIVENWNSRLRLLEVMNRVFKYKSIPHEYFFKVCAELVELKAKFEPLRRSI